MFKFLIFFAPLVFSCKDPSPVTPDPDPVPPDTTKPAEISLSLLVADVTEALFTVSVKHSTLPAQFTLYRNTDSTGSFWINKPDTTIADTLLLPNTNYSWQVRLVTQPNDTAQSEPVSAQTKDTTSHEFTWQVDTLGVYLSLVRDVAILDDNTVWAVGAFYKKYSTLDSIETDLYNLAIWDGNNWELKKIITADAISWNNNETPLYPSKLTSIWAFSSTNVWCFSEAGSYVHYNGAKWTTQYIPDRSGEIQKIWGDNPSNIFFVGQLGTILHFNGSSFRRIPYPDRVDFGDVWGDNSGIVRAVGNQLGKSNISEIVRLTTTSAELEREGLNRAATLPSDPPDIYSSFFAMDGNVQFFQANNGGYRLFNTRFKRLFTNSQYGEKYSQIVVAGNGSNDVFFAGNLGQILHFNGITTKRISDFHDLNNPFYRLAAIKSSQKLTCAGGRILGTGSPEDQTRAIVVIGRRK